MSTLRLAVGCIVAAAVLRVRNPDVWRELVKDSRDLNLELERARRSEAVIASSGGHLRRSRAA